MATQWTADLVAVLDRLPADDADIQARMDAALSQVRPDLFGVSSWSAQGAVLVAGSGCAGVRPWRRITSMSAATLGGPPVVAVRTSRISWK